MECSPRKMPTWRMYAPTNERCEYYFSNQSGIHMDVAEW